LHGINIDSRGNAPNPDYSQQRRGISEIIGKSLPYGVKNPDLFLIEPTQAKSEFRIAVSQAGNDPISFYGLDLLGIVRVSVYGGEEFRETA
jgi:hypothetical protein